MKNVIQDFSKKLLTSLLLMGLVCAVAAPAGFPGPILGTAVSSAPFTPLDLKPDFWVRADQGVMLTAGLVSQWNDISGNSRNLVQAVAGQQPALGATVGGQPAIDFTNAQIIGYSPRIMATNVSPAFATTATRTVFLVLSFVGSQSVDCRIYVTTGDFSTDIFIGAQDISGDVTFIVNSSPRLNGGSDLAGASTITATVNGTAAVLYQNGVSVATGSVTAITPAGNEQRAIGDIAGGGFGCLVDVAEALEWLRVLSGPELAEMNAYALTRYGL